jgi:hypothetical protein
MKQTYKVRDTDLAKISELSNISGDDLIFLLKRLGITMRDYAMMIQPPITTGAGINYYRYHRSGKLPIRLIEPLVEKYPPVYLQELLKQKPERK